MLCKDGELYEIKDVASKAPDNAARLSALFHFLDYGLEDDEIDESSFNTASVISSWHLKEAQRFLGELAFSDDLINMMLLDEWLITYCQREKITQLAVSMLLQFGPRRLRKSQAIELALKELSELNRIKIISNNRSRCIEINPLLFNGE